MHKYGSEHSAAGRVYIQASLHADEIPGILVANHLLKLLDDADSSGQIKKEIVIVPFANPIGLSQFIFGTHLGRFCFDSTTNFNREWKNFTDSVWEVVQDKLTSDADDNVRIIRNHITDVLQKIVPETEEASLKLLLLLESAISDVVLDLHCDTNAVMHMYTHDRLWPQLVGHLIPSPLVHVCQHSTSAFPDTFPHACTLRTGRPGERAGVRVPAARRQLWRSMLR